MDEQVPAHADVVIIGGGLSGLSAADALRGHNVVILEARSRLGGRVHVETERWQDGQLMQVSKGGQWLGPKSMHPEMHGLAERFGVELVAAEEEDAPRYKFGEKLVHDFADVPGLVAAFNELDRLGENMDLARPWTLPEAPRLDNISTWQWLSERLSDTSSVRLAALATTGAFLSVDARAVSALETIFYMKSNGGFAALTDVVGGAQEYRLEGGPSAIVAKLAPELVARGCQIFTNAPVTRLEHTWRGIKVTSTRGSILARQVVITIPPRLISEIAFVPDIPPRSRDALTHRVPGGAIKFQAFYRNTVPKWGVTMKAEADTETFNNSTKEYSGIVGFIYPPTSLQLRTYDDIQLAGWIKEYLREMYNEEAAAPDLLSVSTWWREHWSGGGCFSSHPALGDLVRYQRADRRLMQNVEVAGADVAYEYNGYMEGAVRSGQIAAAKVAARLPQLMQIR